MNALQGLIQAVGDFFRWFFIVAPWQQAVRVRLGKKVALLHAGFHYRIPFVDKIYVHTIRRRMCYVPTQTISTKDHEPVTISGSIGYQIDDLLKLYNCMEHPQDTINQDCMALISQYIAANRLGECSPDKISGYVNDKLALHEYGLTCFGFHVTDFVVVKTFRILNSETNYNSGGLYMDSELFDRGGNGPV